MSNHLSKQQNQEEISLQLMVVSYPVAKSSLARHEVQPKYHFVLSDFDVPKINGKDPDPNLYISAYKRILELINNHS